MTELCKLNPEDICEIIDSNAEFKKWLYGMIREYDMAALEIHTDTISDYVTLNIDEEGMPVIGFKVNPSESSDLLTHFMEWADEKREDGIISADAYIKIASWCGMGLIEVLDVKNLEEIVNEEFRELWSHCDYFQFPFGFIYDYSYEFTDYYAEDGHVYKKAF